MGTEKNRLGAGGREPCHGGSASSTVHGPALHCCMGPRIPKALGRPGKVYPALRSSPGEIWEECWALGCCVLLLLTLQFHPRTISHPPAHLSVEEPCLHAHAPRSRSCSTPVTKLALQLCRLRSPHFTHCSPGMRGRVIVQVRRKEE